VISDERGQVFLPLPKGEGRGDGEERVKVSHALQTSRIVPLTLHPSPVRRERKRVIRQSNIQFLASNVKNAEAVDFADMISSNPSRNDFQNRNITLAIC
jgi:hypothetical protein